MSPPALQNISNVIGHSILPSCCPLHAHPHFRHGRVRPRIRHHRARHQLRRGADPADRGESPPQAPAAGRQCDAEGYARGNLV
ncbi:hypothetical protein D3C72_1424380 [compost metagenome]